MICLTLVSNHQSLPSAAKARLILSTPQPALDVSYKLFFPEDLKFTAWPPSWLRTDSKLSTSAKTYVFL